MSHGSESDEPSTRETDNAALAVLKRHFEVPVLAAVVATMLWIRLQSYDRFIVDGEVFFSGNDAWYHLREVRYTVRNWPQTMPYDVWTNFPVGTSVGQFGTLYDQIVATVALVVGLGSPSPELVAKVLLVSPAVAGALAAIPTYYIAKRLAGRIPGLFAAVVLMLLPGTFLRRTLVGAADHNGVEPLFQATAVAGLVVALAVADRDRPIWELVTAREWETLKPSAAFAALGGTALGLYLWAWPPGVLLVGVFGVYAVFQTVSDYTSGRSPDHIAFVSAVSMATTAGMVLLKLDTTGISATTLGPLHVLATLSVGVGIVGLAWLARQFDGREFDSEWVNANGFPAAVGGLSVVGLGAVVTLDFFVFPLIRSNLLRIVGFSTGAGTRTIAEAQPFLQAQFASIYGPFGAILAEYGFAFLTALLAVLWLLVAPVWTRNEEGDRSFLAFAGFVVGFVFLGAIGPDPFGALTDLFGVDSQVAGVLVMAALLFGATLRARYDAERLFLIVWAAFMTMAAFTQVRFNYYLAVPVAVFNAVFLKQVLGVANISVDDRLSLEDGVPDIETYQVLVVLVVLSLVLVPVLGVPLQLGPRDTPTRTAIQTGDSTGPGQAVQAWDESLSWMQDNTPPQGTFGGADNEIGFYQTTPRPTEGDYAYPEGAYGVQSWWDYGHWITMRGERAPNANPFQEGATAAADFLLAQNESSAQTALERRGTDGAGTRYVMVDWKMVETNPYSTNAKYSAPFAFTTRNVSSDAFFDPVFSRQSGQLAFYQLEQSYYESMAVRLYMFHGSRADSQLQGPFGGQVVVFDYDVTRQNGREFKLLPQGEDARAVRTFRNRSAAEAFVEEDGSASIGGIGPYPNEPVAALQHYRLVHVSNTSAAASRDYQRIVQQQVRATGLPPNFLLGESPRWVKTFEKVPGARVEGSGAAPNETVAATVRLQIPATPNRNATTFTYRQQTTADENGEFSFVLPYSTTGYDEYGPANGYTNVSVRATTAYSISGEIRSNESAYLVANQSSLNVSEGVVNGDRNETLQVTLNETVLSEPQGAQNESGNQTTNETSNVTRPPLDVTSEAVGATGGAGDVTSDRQDPTGSVAATDGFGPAHVERVARPAGS